MCGKQGQPSSVTEVLGMLDRALDFLNGTDAACLPPAVQAETLRALERAEAKHTAALAGVLAAFAGQAAYESDGQGSAGTWLRWQTRVTRGAAAGAVGWVRRIAAHPVIGAALAAGELSQSWARHLCAWTDRLPEGARGGADEILAAAARSGVDLAGLAGLAQEMYERTHRDPDGGGDGFAGRLLWLDTTLGGAGRLTGDLTPGCSAALSAVLDSLSKRAGPEDLRTAAQRRHDALEEACRRLIAAGMLPARAGQPTQVQVHLTLSQLRDLPGASAAEAAWAAARATAPGWLTGPEADAAACDATVVPTVTGYVDWTALDTLTDTYLATRGLRPDPAPRTHPDPGPATAGTPATPHPTSTTGQAGTAGAGSTAGQPGAGRDRVTATCGCTCGGGTCPPRAPLPPATLARLRQTMLHLAADVLSGPGGLAAWLRQTQLTGTPGGSPSIPLAVPLPLDTGEAEATIPAHLRRAVLTRHRHRCFPGCPTPATACQIHHIIPRSRGGPTTLDNLVPMCAFHHLIVIHRWGWTLRLNADGTTAATSPDGRIVHDHDPPGRAA